MPRAADKRTELRRLVRAARQHLELEQAHGSGRIPFSQGRVTELRRKHRLARSRSGSRSKAAQLEELRTELAPCCQCGLGKTRTRLVFGDGSPDADLMFIGEAPGYQEDRQGVPFVGPAGQLLTRIIEAIGLTRDEVYIGNVLKCRPPNNRTPAPDEVAECFPHLLRQIEIIRPKIIVALGNPATRAILQTTEGITRLRGKFVEWHGIHVMPTFHPSYLLHSPSEKRKVWNDMKKVWALMKKLGLTIGELKKGGR